MTRYLHHRLWGLLSLGLLLGLTPGCSAETIDKTIEQGFRRFIVEPLSEVIFFDLWFWDNSGPGDTKVPLIVAWLFCGAIFFTLRYRFINLRGFAHAVQVLRGKFSDGHAQGEVTHFQALSSALSATVGLGNIGGVAVAIGVGGPGAVPWMMLAGFLGMSSKFVECTLSQMYRSVNSKGHVLGGPMRYIEAAVYERFGKNRRRLAKICSATFSVLCIGASLGAGCMFQSNQSYAQTARFFPGLASVSGAFGFGVLLAALVGVVILGGVKRIGRVAGVVVPVMCAVYVCAGLYIIATHAAELPAALRTIFRGALAPEAQFGGAIGVMMTGLRRACFSNEAGVGSAPIVHAAATTKEPVREGLVALLEPFIDTVLICTITALVVILTGTYRESAEGVVMTSNAFGQVLPWFPYVLTVAVWLFSFSTMISWSYYGERAVEHLFGEGRTVAYRWLFLLCGVLGATLPLRSVLDFADLMMLGMAFLNVPALILLGSAVQRELNKYAKTYM